VAQFYAEIEGHPSERHVDHALDELQFFSTRLKIIGIYPRHPLRHTL
jgi:prephenate dehydratase